LGRGAFIDFEKKISNAARNNIIERMHESYGKNIVILDNPTPQELTDFTHQFNQKFEHNPPKVNFVVTSHYGNGEYYGDHPYTDQILAVFLDSIKGKEKCAVIYACGAKAKEYHLKNFNYVLIPSPDGNINGAEMSIKALPAYSDAIGWMRESSDAEFIKAKLAEKSAISKAVNTISGDVWGEIINKLNHSTNGHNHNPPAVITDNTPSKKDTNQHSR
jgi:hypothetical protein